MEAAVHICATAFVMGYSRATDMNTTTFSWERPSIFSIVARRLAIFAVLLATFALAGCSKEPEQRKAFMTFLQTRIIDKKGGGMPILNAQDKKDFGVYADHYQVMFAFNAEMHQASKSFNDVNGLQRRLGNAKGLQDNWQEIASLRAEFPKIGQALTSALQKAQTARDALKQPDDLKAVYDQAFNKTVTAPAQAFQSLLQPMEKTFQALEDMGRFLSDNRSNVKISGMVVETEDPALLAQFQQLQQKSQDEANGLIAAEKAFDQLR